MSMASVETYRATDPDWVSFRDGTTAGTADPPPPSGDRWLYTSAQVTEFITRMSGAGPYYARGDAGHGGSNSPDDGAKSVGYALAFLASPSQSYWTPSSDPYDWGGQGMQYRRPMHAAWCWMTQASALTSGQRDTCRSEAKAWLLNFANHAEYDWEDDAKYDPSTYPGYWPSLQNGGHFLKVCFKTREMLGQDTFTDAENNRLDRWFYGYANFIFALIQDEIGGKVPGRLSGDFSSAAWPNSSYVGYDGGPVVHDGYVNGHNNRVAMAAAAASNIANYLKASGYTAPSGTQPFYGFYSVDDLVFHSKLFFEESIHFSLFPAGFYVDIARSWTDNSNTRGWEYSANAVASIIDMAAAHAIRGDTSLLNYATSAGLGNSAGVPVAGGFADKDVHYAQWAISRYVSGGWGRTIRNGGSIVSSTPYRDVLPAAKLDKYVTDAFITSAWQRSGNSFPAYTSSFEHQGPYYNSQHGEGGTYIGLIEVGGV